ncbi:MAG: mannonate dehydratase [Clostridia bacterium]|nr:mannonate dehydratase [Clostridia bacterium]
MELTFRWFGDDDPVKLEYIKQIPNMEGIVSALYDVEIGDAWPLDKILELKKKVENEGLKLSVIESVPVHEDIKLGLDTKDQYIENYIESIRNISKAGIKTICYNFMPVFDWTRSSIDKELEDGSKTLIYDHKEILKMDQNNESISLPGWAANYEDRELKGLLSKYKVLTDEKMWENLEYFLKKIIPVAEEASVKMAIHPDDPPWSIFGLPRIVTNKDNLERLVNIVDSPSNGLTICTGSLGVDNKNDIIDIIKHFGNKEKINFVHFRNIKRFEDKNFDETAHASNYGSLDMYCIIKACVDFGYDGPIRPDHGRMIFGETGKAGYGLYDRALGATYFNGLLEAIVKSSN